MAFSEGHEKKGGRTKGTPNTFTKTVKQVFTDTFNDLQSDPLSNLSTWGRSNPTEFYKLCGKLIPTAVDLKADVEVTKQIFKIGNTEIEL